MAQADPETWLGPAAGSCLGASWGRQQPFWLQALTGLGPNVGDASMWGADRDILLWINTFAHRDKVLDLIIFHLGSDIVAGIIFLYLVYLWFVGVESRREALKISFGLVISVLVNGAVIWCMPFRLRPIHQPGLGFVLPYFGSADVLEHWSSFPSDHAAVYVAMATAIFMHHRALGLGSLVWVLGTGLLSRVYFGIHYPADIIGGALVGIVTMYAVYWFPTDRLLARIYAVIETAERNYAPYFYPTAALFLYELITLFSDTRTWFRFTVHLFTGQLGIKS